MNQRSSAPPSSGNVEFQVFRFALDPNNKQRGHLASHAGGARYAYNLGLEWLIDSLEKRRAGGSESTPNASEMHRRWNRWKKIRKTTRCGGLRTPSAFTKRRSGTSSTPSIRLLRLDDGSAAGDSLGFHASRERLEH